MAVCLHNSLRMAQYIAVLRHRRFPGFVLFVALSAAGTDASAQGAVAAPTSKPAAAAATIPLGVTAPPGYVIGADDQLAVIFWREQEMSADVAVRPDGMISLPLINDIRASGLTPEELRVSVSAAAAKFVEDTTVTIVVKAINSRRVFITGQVNKPGTYPLAGPTSVLQLIALAGGLLEYADAEQITILRTAKDVPVALRFNYDEVANRKKLEQNINLLPGDTVVVP